MAVTVNLWGALVSAVASMIIGSVWYGPLFGKKFMVLMGMDKLTAKKQAEMKKGMAWTYLWQFLASVVMFIVLSGLIAALGQLTVLGGMCVALLVWIGFVVPLALGGALWGGKMALFWLEAGNMFLTLLAAGAILGAWG